MFAFRFFFRWVFRACRSAGAIIQVYFFLLVIIKNIRYATNEISSWQNKSSKYIKAQNHPSSVAEMLGLGSSNTSTLTSVFFTFTSN